MSRRGLLVDHPMRHINYLTTLLLLAVIACSTPRSPNVVAAPPSATQLPRDLLDQLDSDLTTDPGSLLEHSQDVPARASALAASGAYSEALRLIAENRGALSSAEQQWLKPRESFWQMLRYASTDGDIFYDEELRMREPLGVRGFGDDSSPEQHALYRLGTTRTMIRQVLSFGQGPTFLESVSADAMRELCPPGQSACTRGIPFVFSVDRFVDFPRAEAQLLAAIADVQHRRDSVELGWLWMLLGDAYAAPNSSAMSLNLYPFMSNTLSEQNSGTHAPEFDRPTPSAAKQACDHYEKARDAWRSASCRRCSAELMFRQSYLTLMAARCQLHDTDVPLPPFARAAALFDAAGDRRRALASYAAELAVARGSGSSAAVATRGTLLDRAAQSDPGPVTASARVLARYARKLWTTEGKFEEAWRLYDDAMALARAQHAEFVATSIGTDQAELAAHLGRFAEANDLRESHLASLGRYKAAVPTITLFANNIEQEQSQVCLVAFELASGMRANLLSMGAFAVPEWRSFDVIARENYACAPIAPEHRRFFERSFTVQDVTASLYDLEFDLAIKQARQMNDEVLEANAWCLARNVPRALHAMKSPVSRALAVAKDAKAHGTLSAPQILLLQEARGHLEQLVMALSAAGAFAQAAALLESGDTAYGSEWLFASASTPWARSHIRATLAAGLGKLTEAASLYAQTIEQLDGHAPDARGAYDDQTASIRNDYIAFLARSGRTQEALRYFERSRRRAFLAPGAERDLDLTKLTLPALIYHVWGQDSGVFVTRPGFEPVYYPMRSRPYEITKVAQSYLRALESGSADWKKSARAAYTMLFADADAALRAADGGPRGVLIIPHGQLQALPFQALVDPDGKPLIARFDFVYAPDLQSFVRTSERASSMIAEANANEIDVLAYNGAVLTNAEQAANDLATGRAARGADATTQALWQMLAMPGVLHVGAHASQDWLHPNRSAIALASGDLHIRDLEGAVSGRRAVVLAACDTANAILRGGENRATWPMAFATIGVPTVVGSYWKIEDKRSIDGVEWSSEAMFRTAYQRIQHGESIGGALASTQRELAAVNDFRAHPHYWAAFSTYGAGL